MKTWSRHRWYGTVLTSAELVLSCLVSSAFAGGGPVSDLDVPFTIPRAVCGPNDHPETALQGQVPANLRAAGFQGFNCNLQLVGQSKGDGANWQTAEFKDRLGHTCAYHGTAFTRANRTNLGVPVIDVTNASNPTPTGYLTTISMLDPWESPGTTTRSPGSNHAFRAGHPTPCDAERGTLWTTCQDNGLLMLKFTNNVWPFPDSSTPPGQQN